MEVEDVKVVLETSTGIEIEVWREDELYHAHRVGRDEEPQICLGIDLFEVISELADLDLDSDSGSAEAVRLAEQAQRELLIS
jgi:hypothetical protein